MGGKYVSDAAERAVRATVEVARRKGVSPSQVAIAWLLHQPGVTSPIIGARKLEHLADNMDAVNVDLSADDLATLDEASRTPLGFPHDFILEADANITGGATILPPPQGRLV
jgi:aryl-alcohol dehydrogenase-like predicted oxidoreductase